MLSWFNPRFLAIPEYLFHSKLQLIIFQKSSSATYASWSLAKVFNKPLLVLLATSFGSLSYSPLSTAAGSVSISPISLFVSPGWTAESTTPTFNSLCVNSTSSLFSVPNILLPVRLYACFITPSPPNDAGNNCFISP